MDSLGTPPLRARAPAAPPSPKTAPDTETRGACTLMSYSYFDLRRALGGEESIVDVVGNYTGLDQNVQLA